MTACNIAVMLCCVHVDSDDSAVTRLLKLLMSLFSGWRLRVKMGKQRNEVTFFTEFCASIFSRCCCCCCSSLLLQVDVKLNVWLLSLLGGLSLTVNCKDGESTQGFYSFLFSRCCCFCFNSIFYGRLVSKQIWCVPSKIVTRVIRNRIWTIMWIICSRL